MERHSSAELVAALGAMGDNRAVKPLARLLTTTRPADAGGDPDWQADSLRRTTAEALGNFRDPRARAALIRAIDYDPAWEVYHAARRALYRMDFGRFHPPADELAELVHFAVFKQPEPPEGAEAAVKKWQANEANKGGAWTGPMVFRLCRPSGN